MAAEGDAATMAMGLGVELSVVTGAAPPSSPQLIARRTTATSPSSRL
jgi:hypothetical protein